MGRVEIAETRWAADGGVGKTLRVNPVTRPILALALPSDDELPVGVHGHRGDRLNIRGKRVGIGFAAQPDAVSVEARVGDPGSSVEEARARPGDHEVAVAIHRHYGKYLIRSSEIVHPEPASLCSSRGAVALGK